MGVRVTPDMKFDAVFNENFNCIRTENDNDYQSEYMKNLIA